MTSNLRIALLVDPLTVLVQGARHAVELKRELEARGHEVHVFGAPQSLLAASDGALEGPEPPPVRMGGVLGLEPDVVIAYDALSPVALIGSRVARRRRIPLLLVEAGRIADRSLPQRALGRIGELLWGPYVRRTCTSLVALDPVAREHALAEGFGPARIHTLPQGVDLDRYRPGLPSPLVFEHRIRGRILLYAGSHESHAGLEMLIDAFARTVGQRGDWSLVLAGRRHAPPRLRATAHRLGVAARVHFLKVGEADLPPLFASSTLVAQPARDDRTSGLTILRAMAASRPVIASDLPRLRYVVEPEGSGLLVPAADLNAWTRTIQRAASSPEARKRWGRRGRELVEERFSWRLLAADWERRLREAQEELGTRELGEGAGASEAARA